MNFAAATVIAVGVAVDAFAASVADGTRYSRHKRMDCLKTAFAFGLAQAMMVLLGYGLGDLLWLRAAGVMGHWVAAVILFLLGGKMVCDGLNPDQPEGRFYAAAYRPLTLLFEAVAVSIDALAVGVSIAVFSNHIFWPVLYIGLVAAMISAIGFSAGHYIGERLLFSPELLGGAMLVTMALHLALNLLF